MTEVVHKLSEMGNGCICKEPGCKKWKDSFITPGKEKRCPRCWTRASLMELDYGKFQDWCFNCQLPI